MDSFLIQLTQLRPVLLRSARSRLRNPDWAEDAVSETLLAALQKRPDFHDPARIRSWLYGILRNKLVDQVRVHLRDDDMHLLSDCAEGEEREICDPSPQANPMHLAESRQFVVALRNQLQTLSPMQADAFVMRECLGDATEEVCDKLAISAGNLWVVLHRTRLRLRQTLAEHRA
jgi:RNA polymerase sigma-70 factor (TIGR02943 family)